MGAVAAAVLTGCAARVVTPAQVVTPAKAGAQSPGDAIETAFAPTADATRGREVFTTREGGHCVLCHAAPGVAIAGNIGPSMAGVGLRLTPAQIRLRVADITRVNPDAVMPVFHRTEGLRRVAADYRGKPVLSAQEVEDVVAWLSTLK